MRRALGLLFLLGGCYMQGGLGVAPGQATLHGSMGFVAHFGGAASVHVGAGGGLGPYKGGAETGTVSTHPLSVGGEVTVLASGQNSLVATVDVQPPLTGRLHTPDFDTSEKAHTTRGYAGVGYHHVWWQEPKTPDGGSGVSRPVGAITVELGPEMWRTTSDYHPSSTRFGGAFSLTIEVRATLLGEAFECLGSKHGCS